MDLLRVVEESKTGGSTSSSLYSTFIALTPKKSKPSSFDDFRPIDLCKFIYKLISKIIIGRFKPKLVECLSQEQFGFLNKRQILDAIEVSLDCLHSIKTKKILSMVLKVDLNKSYFKMD